MAHRYPRYCYISYGLPAEEEMDTVLTSIG